ncbi:hypothetical protein ACWD4V_18270 [Streptomyces tsukubensis]
MKVCASLPLLLAIAVAVLVVPLPWPPTADTAVAGLTVSVLLSLPALAGRSHLRIIRVRRG